MPYSEPNSLPSLFDSWQDWRDTYTAYVENFNASTKHYSDEVQLKIRLRRIGFVGINLDREIEFIKEN